MTRPTILFPLLIALVCIWSVVGIVMRVTEDDVSSPEKVMGLINNPPWSHGKKPDNAERRAYLDRVVRFHNLLDLEQKQRLREEDGSGTMMFFLADLHEDERKDFLKSILESQFQPLMKIWANLPKEERRKFVSNSKNDMRKNGRDTTSLDALTADDDKVFEKLIEGSISDYYASADAKKKMNLAPLMEELQRRVQGKTRR